MTEALEGLAIGLAALWFLLGLAGLALAIYRAPDQPEDRP